MPRRIDLIPAAVFGYTGVSLIAASTTNCWAIDQTSQAAGGADNGFLDCARSHTPGYSSHGSTAEAVNNLLACRSSFASGERLAKSDPQECEPCNQDRSEVPRYGKETSSGNLASVSTANIVGHGNDGLIVTGQGQSPSDPNKYIYTYNQSNWGPELQRLNGKFAIIKLWACHPGTAQDGADLLYNMMLVTNAICMGPTGFLYCNSGGFSLEANSTWQVATPGQPKPAPIAAPTPHFAPDFGQLVMQFEGAWQVLKMDSITSVEIQRGGTVLLTATGDSARNFVRLIDFTSPLEIDGAVGAIVTGELSITAKDDAGHQAVHRFVVYNNRLLQSLDNPRLHYRCSDGFARTLLVGIR